MKKYDKYKDSGIEWIGEIPEHWEVKKIKYSVDLIMGQSPDSRDCNSIGNGIPFLQGNADFNYINPLPQNWCERPTKVAPLNSVLLSVRAPIGAVNIADKNYCIGRGLCALISENPKFLYYHVICLHDELNSFGTGSTFRAISTEQILNTYILIPPPEEQTAIANYLDKKTAQIDGLIADKKRLLELYEEEKTAIINQTVTKGIKPDVPMKDSGIEWLGKIPEHWEVKKLKYLGNIVLGKMLTSSDKGNYHKRKYLRAANIGWLKVNIEDVKEMWFSDDELISLRLNKNDLLVSEGGEVGRTCIWKNELKECYIQNSVHKIAFNNSNNPFYYLYQFFLYGQKGAFDAIVNRISIAHLTGEKIRNIDFPVPPLEEQTAIVQHIEKEINRINAKAEKTKKLIELLEEYKQALISEVVTGKVKVV